MSLESDLFTVIGALVSNRCYPDTAPNGVSRPYVIYQKVGGEAWNYLETDFHGFRNARVQVSVWSETRAATAALARSIEVALVENTTLRAYVLGAVIDAYEGDTSPPLYGTRQDFSIRY